MGFRFLLFLLLGSGFSQIAMHYSISSQNPGFVLHDRQTQKSYSFATTLVADSIILSPNQSWFVVQGQPDTLTIYSLAIFGKVKNLLHSAQITVQKGDSLIFKAWQENRFIYTNRSLGVDKNYLYDLQTKQQILIKDSITQF